MEEAIAAWKRALGEEQVGHGADTLDRYARSMQPGAHRPACVLYPQHAGHVQAVVQVAREHRIRLYPISRGKNWGYGDAAPLHADAAIVDLSRMSRIVEINRELAYTVIEPGVTQGQLYAALQREAPELWMDCTGAGLDASVVGNVLERGFGHTPYGDHSRTACAFEVVTGTGEILRTGFSRFMGAAQHLYPHGVGVSLQDLFTQSSFGIVTRMTIWLYPRPMAFRCLYLLLRREEALPELLDALRDLRLRGILNSAVHLGNDLRVLSSQMTYPWKDAGDATPLPESLRLRLRAEAGIGPWNLTASLAGTPAQVRGGAREVRRRLGHFGRLVFVDDRRLYLAGQLHRALRRFGLGAGLGRKLALLEPNYGLLKGIPTDAPLQAVYWRTRKPPEDVREPLDSGCGLYWLSPVLPLTGTHAVQLMARMSALFTRFGYDLPVTFTLLNERSMVAVMNVSFDLGLPAEVNSASALYEAAMTELLELGFVPYRVGPRAMQSLAAADLTHAAAVRAIKAVFDPEGIISPGRYVPLDQVAR